MNTNFPDEEYLRGLVNAHKERVEGQAELVELLVMWSGASLNWIGDVFTDPAISWVKKDLHLPDLYLTGTNPEWNVIIRGRADHSAEKLGAIFRSEPATAEIFSEATWSDVPILVMAHGGHLKVFDGMHRVIAAVRDDRKSITAWVGERDAKIPPRPSCEPHTVYDLIRAYQIGSCRDRQSLVAALGFLYRAYGNVGHLFTERFSAGWIPDDEIQDIMREAVNTQE
ncbi:MAG: hypothetical protein U9Q03_05490 [Patescibacteria group bacterium]|nr:hypothetical protein [Patescibacteria group bacterium]